MISPTPFDYARPFDIMIGMWTGHSIVYDNKGEYLYTGPSILTIDWKEPGKVMHYRQEDLGSLDQLIQEHEHGKALEDLFVLREFELQVDGKSCQSITGAVKVHGVESSPGTYLFHLNFPTGDYYNNQYFLNPNQRRIIGPFVPRDEEGKTNGFQFVVSQTFERISYDVPKDAF
ncbi:hypothetical protein [Ruegeria lacuscaerulensis]|uniref:hypothetical protein n=1 Tax=Ruegeria lacuscaerulensis TaxID=55218 RepID=UPI00147F7D0E|nr:hypothetical protein [Ruegeria lacuscaerulensis]